MSLIEDVRARNLYTLIQQSTLADVSRRAKRNAAQLSQMSRGKRTFGERVARGIEEAMHLPPGWFDQPHDKTEGQAEEQPTVKGVPYLSAETANLFPVPTIVLQGGETTMNNVIVYFDGDIFRRNFPDQTIEDFSAAIVLDTSMSPALNPMDRVLIDTSKPRFTTSGIYCLDTPAGKILRRMTSTLDGKHMVSTDSAPEEKQLLEEYKGVSIIGRVQMVWNARKI